MNIAIVDDDRTQLEYLGSLTYDIVGREDNTVSLFESSEEFMFRYSSGVYDLLLLDIQMKGDSGITLAEKLRFAGDNVPVIFITAVPDFVFSGYDVGARQYLLKPVDAVKLKACILAVKDKEKTSEKIFFSSDGELFAVPADDIFYLEAIAHNTKIVFRKKELTVTESLGECIKKLPDFFVKCHRSYSVNLKAVKSVKKYDIVLDNGALVPVSRRMFADFSKMFIDFYRGAL